MKITKSTGVGGYKIKCGVYQAVVTHVVDIGNQKLFNEKTGKQFEVVWEMNEKHHGKNMQVSNTYFSNMNDEGVAHMEAILGTKINEDPVTHTLDFDTDTLIGKNCFLVISDRKRDGNLAKNSFVSDVSPLVVGTPLMASSGLGLPALTKYRLEHQIK
jgi:hypothetical protein